MSNQKEETTFETVDDFIAVADLKLDYAKSVFNAAVQWFKDGQSYQRVLGKLKQPILGLECPAAPNDATDAETIATKAQQKAQEEIADSGLAGLAYKLM